MKYRFKPEECNHENTGKEYELGAQTGDYVCYDCGYTSSEKIKKKSSTT